MTAILALAAAVTTTPLAVTLVWVRATHHPGQHVDRPGSTTQRRLVARPGPHIAYQAAATDAHARPDAALVAAERALRGRWHTDGARISAGELIAWAAARQVAIERDLPIPALEDPR
jgi:hypothetical protein